MLTNSKHTWVKDEKKNYIDIVSKRDHPKQLETDNVSTYDVKTLDTNKKINLLLAHMLANFFPKKTKRMHKKNKRNKWQTIYRESSISLKKLKQGGKM